MVDLCQRWLVAAATMAGCWQCHCCLRENATDRTTCECCGRPASYRLEGSRPLLSTAKMAGMRVEQLEEWLADVDEQELAGPRGPINERDEAGWTPLHVATLARNAPVAAALVARGALVEACTAEGWRPLHLAAHVGCGEIAATLLSAGAEVSRTTACGRTPLHLCVDAGSARLLLKAGANPLATDALGRTCVHAACEEGHLAVAEALLESGPVAIADDDAWLPEAVAELRGNWDMVALCKDVEARDRGIVREELEGRPWMSWRVFQGVREGLEGRRRREEKRGARKEAAEAQSILALRAEAWLRGGTRGGASLFDAYIAGRREAPAGSTPYARSDPTTPNFS